ncbi:MAG: bifunctional 4-hydroxy-3-methylbut-2-enyl diphosphate reductase/30S ribosomal protein S1 [Halanaerobiaceae bacterium]|nr:bifunctional 4-hydroxy-3-methylbut-2-enyl diphosphate reductase/30S ribosomal protein S1 [Halanaerobiaceae bacterium]
MDFIIAEEAGFCFGVKRAIERAMETAQSSASPVYTLGPIIHNPQVVKKLEEKGVRAIDSLEEIEEGVVIIRSHGVSPDVIKAARERGLTVVDATCPFVTKAQRVAKSLVDEGYQTIIFGDPEHPEVKGIYGSTGGKAYIVNNIEELQSLKLSSKIGFLAQTTKSPESFRDLLSSVIERSMEIKIHNTICNTTETRQRSARELAEKVDLMFVIGGYNSANTKRLAEICLETGTPTYHIETAADIDKQWLKNKEKIGITAGASTPEWLIKEVIEAMSEEKKDLKLDENITEEGVVDGTETNENTAEVNNESPAVENNLSEEIDYSIADLKRGQIVKGTVSQIKEDGVYVDVNYKTDGFIPLRELTYKDISDPHEIVELNEEIDVVVLTLEDSEGNMILSKKRADFEKAWESIMDAFENNKIIEAEVTKVVKGGLVADVGLRGFIPASHVAIGFVENLDEYVGKTLRLKVIEVERDKNNVVLSAREVLEEEKEKEKEKTLANLEAGQTVKGQITKLVDFGAFVDLGGVEGLLHISEMSWGRIGHPSEMFEEGQEIEVKVLSIDKDEERISLGYKQLLPDPWQEFVKKHYEGEVISGTVTKIVDFGAFVEVGEGVEGLIHISQLSHRHVKTPDEVVSEGEEVQVKILNIDEGQKRVGLSIKELQEKSAVKVAAKPEVQKEEEGSGGVTIRELVGDIFNTAAEENTDTDEE